MILHYVKLLLSKQFKESIFKNRMHIDGGSVINLNAFVELVVVDKLMIFHSFFPTKSLTFGDLLSTVTDNVFHIRLLLLLRRGGAELEGKVELLISHIFPSTFSVWEITF